MSAKDPQESLIRHKKRQESLILPHSSAGFALPATFLRQISSLTGLLKCFARQDSLIQLHLLRKFRRIRSSAAQITAKLLAGVAETFAGVANSPQNAAFAAHSSPQSSISWQISAPSSCFTTTNSLTHNNLQQNMGLRRLSPTFLQQNVARETVLRQLTTPIFKSWGKKGGFHCKPLLSHPTFWSCANVATRRGFAPLHVAPQNLRFWW